MSEKSKSYPRNAPGDFYVEDSCCTACDVPFYYAPDLFKYDETELHCFVAKQPTDDQEIYQMIMAVWAAELQCIRYQGDNPQILRRLAEASVPEVCDQQQFVRGIAPLLRNHVTFTDSRSQSEEEIATLLKDYILSRNSVYDRYRATPIKTAQEGATFSFYWYENNYHEVWCNELSQAGDWHVFHSPTAGEPASYGISQTIDEWLRSDQRFTNLKWFSNQAWKKSQTDWQETPI